MFYFSPNPIILTSTLTSGPDSKSPEVTMKYDGLVLCKYQLDRLAIVNGWKVYTSEIKDEKLSFWAGFPINGTPKDEGGRIDVVVVQTDESLSVIKFGFWPFGDLPEGVQILSGCTFLALGGYGIDDNNTDEELVLEPNTICLDYPLDLLILLKSYADVACDLGLLSPFQF